MLFKLETRLFFFARALCKPQTHTHTHTHTHTERERENKVNLYLKKSVITKGLNIVYISSLKTWFRVCSFQTTMYNKHGSCNYVRTGKHTGEPKHLTVIHLWIPTQSIKVYKVPNYTKLCIGKITFVLQWTNFYHVYSF